MEEKILTYLNIIKNDKYKWKKYVPKFNKIAKDMKVNMNTYEGQKQFGKACSFYVNKQKSDETLKSEKLKHFIYNFLTIITYILIIFLIVVNVLNISTDSELIRRIVDDIETFVFIFLGVILIYIFFPVFPKPIISKTDIRLVYSAGMALFLIGIFRFFKIEKNIKKEEEILKQSEKNKKESEEILKQSEKNKKEAEEILKRFQNNKE